MKKLIQLLFVVVIVSLAACKSGKTKDGFTVLPNGLEVKMVEDKEGEKADSGSVASINIIVKAGDSIVFDSKQMNNNQPLEQPIMKSKMMVDLMDGFMMMSKGDKAIFRVLADSIFPDPSKRPPFIKAGDVMSYEVDMVDLKTFKQITKDMNEALANEGSLIEDYIAKNNIQAEKLPSGIYIQTISAGSGEVAQNGKLVQMDYTGALLDGTLFDSNVNPAFGHVQPFEFVLGQGQVIKGWDIAVATLKKGAKAKLIIPSTLAYGPRAMPGSEKNPKGIPANSTLVFDVTLKDIKEVPQAQPSAQGPQIQVQPN